MSKQINVAKLKEQIAMPNWEKRLLPLFLFKGTKPNAIRTNWNYVYAMYLAEVETWGVAAWREIEEQQHGLAHLCGKHSMPQGLWGFFNRLRACQKLTDSVDKGFSEYIEWLMPGPCVLQPVPITYSHYHHGQVAWWRKIAPKKIKIWREPKEITRYPFVQSISAKTPEQQLLLDVHAQIPRGIDPSIRGDLCQDLIVAVLSGDIKVSNIPDVLHRYKTVARKLLPHPRSVSFDSEFDNGDERTLHTTIPADCDHA